MKRFYIVRLFFGANDVLEHRIYCLQKSLARELSALLKIYMGHIFSSSVVDEATGEEINL